MFSDSFQEEKILTPVTDAGNMGGLVPVSALDQTLDDMLVSLPPYLDVSSHTEVLVNFNELKITYLYKIIHSIPFRIHRK